MGANDATWPPAPARARGPLPWLDETSETPVPPTIVLGLIARYESQIEEMRHEIHELNGEVHALRADLSRVLSVLDARAKADTRFWDHASSICSAFANDGKVRLALIVGVILIGLVLSGVSALSWRDGGLAFEAVSNERAHSSDLSPAP